MKNALFQNLRSIRITDNDIEWGDDEIIVRGRSSVVYKAGWNGQQVAVKKLKLQLDGIGSVDLVQFPAEAFLNTLVHRLNIASVLPSAQVATWKWRYL